MLHTVILRLTPETATLEGETADEWQLLEKQVRAGTVDLRPRADVDRLRALAAELGSTIREEGIVPWRRKRPRPPDTDRADHP